MKKILTAIAALGLLGACAEEAELAEEEVVTDGAMTESVNTAGTWDTNNDGSFQQAEYSTFADTYHSTWDADADGQLTQAEFNSGWTGINWSNPEGAFTAFDDNSDGTLGEDEFFSEGQWSEWDANKDGSLDQNEWTF